jgi:hypothetical protein
MQTLSLKPTSAARPGLAGAPRCRCGVSGLKARERPRLPFHPWAAFVESDQGGLKTAAISSDRQGESGSDLESTWRVP